MKRVILSESERKNILFKHNLLFEGVAEDQQIMTKFKNEFMSKSYNEIADGLEKMKSAPNITPQDIEEINKAVEFLRKNNFMSGTAKTMVDDKFNSYIKDKPEVAKDMLCYLVIHNQEYSNPEINSFCVSGPKEQEIMKNIESEVKKAADKIKVNEPKKEEPTKSNNNSSFMDPYSSGANTSPGSFMNPYGS